MLTVQKFNRLHCITFGQLSDYVIGNPPYQEDAVGEQKTHYPPIYDKFMSASYEVADKVELITPARFLFNAGATPAAWNKERLNDKHFKVLEYEADSSKYFNNVDIKGGIAITYRDENKDFGAIETFTPYEELNLILHKVKDDENFVTFKNIVYSRTLYKFNDKMHEENPEAKNQVSKGHLYDMSTNIFDILPQIFYDLKPNDGNEYIQIYGLKNRERIYRWCRQDFVNQPESLYKWKVFVPAANGSGALGEVLTTPVIGQPVIGQPVIGHTETFMTIGSFDTEKEARACLKYVKSKFLRAMLGILKVTQHNAPDKWKYVPLQDFTDKSDIDWSKPIPEIDAQLYAKYGLDDSEIDFIESKVKAME